MYNGGMTRPDDREWFIRSGSGRRLLSTRQIGQAAVIHAAFFADLRSNFTRASCRPEIVVVVAVVRSTATTSFFCSAHVARSRVPPAPPRVIYARQPMAAGDPVGWRTVDNRRHENALSHHASSATSRPPISSPPESPSCDPAGFPVSKRISKRHNCLRRAPFYVSNFHYHAWFLISYLIRLIRRRNKTSTTVTVYYGHKDGRTQRGYRTCPKLKV